MNDQGGQSPQQSQSSKKKSPPILLIILLPILAVALIGLLIDYRARWAAENAATTVRETFDERDKSDKGLMRDEVHKLIGIEPDEGTDKKTETYTWKGVFYRYKLNLGYGSSDERLETFEKKSESVF